MKQKILTYVASVVISVILGSIGFLTTGCKTNDQIQIIHPQVIVTNHLQTTSFNDERYVWENFYFSTNQVNDTKK